MTRTAAAIESRSTVVRRDGLPTTPVDEDLVILDMAGNNYVGLDAIGRHIWALIETPRSVSDICHVLALEYADESAAIEQDVIAFLDALSDDGLVRVTPG